MKYEVTNQGITIDFEDMNPIEGLMHIAKCSYELARPVGFGFLQPNETNPEEVDFSGFIVHGNGLGMDYVNGRQCKTRIDFYDGKYHFNRHLFERDRGSATDFLDYSIDQLTKKA